ncbi:hypothetical protein [Streptomyces phaeofaciens]|uniref:hypothetical protein n=1 Tax=Streptomyces phaeofaciens TaxID=68254 RepID=UPI00368F3DCE
MAGPAPAERVPAPAPVPAPPAPAPVAPGAAPGAAPGLLADELSRVLVPADVPKDELALRGGAELTAGPAVSAYLDGKGKEGGPVRVRLGNTAAGPLTLRRTEKGGLETPGTAYQWIPLLHPLLLPLRAEGIEPVLALRVHDGLLQGHASARVKGRLLDDGRALLERMENCTRALGWLGVEGLRLPNVENELKGPTLVVSVSGMSFSLGGFLTASGGFGIANDIVTFDAVARGTIGGLGQVEVPVSRGADGAPAGKATVDVKLRGFAGQVTAAFGGGNVDVRGTVRYTNDKFDGSVTLVATDAKSAKELTDAQLPEQVKAAGPAAAPAAGPAPAVPQPAGPAGPAGPRPGPRVLAGWGTVDVALADWLRGEALVVVDHHGDVTVVGKILPRMDKPLFEQKDYVKQLATFEIRASYGVPLVGNVFLFANVGLEALAKIGPATLTKMELSGTWSTKPEVLRSFGLTATLNISAFAGLRLRAEGGAGVEILGHDIKTGIGLWALAGIRGYVEATPAIGFREVADPAAGKRGEFFVAGHMEIAAQPFLGLGGDLFVELDSPWWSPAPDQRWTWPLGQLEYPLPGQFGIGADVEHVLGSGKIPEITFGKADFNAGKFLTDLVNDHVPPKGSTGEEETKGSWSAPGTAAAPPGSAPAAVPGPAAGAPAPAPAGKPGAPAPGAPGAADKAGKGDESVPSPEKLKRWHAGLAALGELSNRSHRNPYDASELRDSLAGLKKQYGFTVLAGELRGGKWQITAGMSPTTDKLPPIDADVTGAPTTAAAGEKARLPESGEPTTAYLKFLWNRLRKVRLEQPGPARGGPIGEDLSPLDRQVLTREFPQTRPAEVTFRMLAVRVKESEDADTAGAAADAATQKQADDRAQRSVQSIYGTLKNTTVPGPQQSLLNGRARGTDEYAQQPLAPAARSIDHVVSKKEFAAIPEVALLEHDERLAVLHNIANLRLQERAANSARGETPWPDAGWMSEWYDTTSLARAVRYYDESRAAVMAALTAAAARRTRR